MQARTTDAHARVIGPVRPPSEGSGHDHSGARPGRGRRWLGLLFVTGLAAGAGWWTHQRRAEASTLAKLHEALSHGTDTSLRALQTLELDVATPSSWTRLDAAKTLARWCAAIELGAPFPSDADAILAALRASQTDLAPSDLALFEALEAMSRGELKLARRTEDEHAPGPTSETPDRDASSLVLDVWPFAPTWIAARATAADPEASSDERRDALAKLETALRREPTNAALVRTHAELLLSLGQARQAVAQLAAASRADDHPGLLADEALGLASTRQDWPRVVDLSSKVLTSQRGGPRDHARATLARGLAHLFAGERELALVRFGEAYTELPAWDLPARTTVVHATLLAGDAERGLAYLAKLPRPGFQHDLAQAHLALVQGDAARSLEVLATLPQSEPEVAYLQGLALVEQRRYREASSWLARAERLLPERLEIAIARARIEVHEGRAETALPQLRRWAEEEPFAPRALTGLGEAYLALAGPAPDPDREDATTNPAAPDDPSLRRQAEQLSLAEHALLRAVEREPVPAEAMLRLGDLELRRNPDDPAAPAKAETWRRRAAASNPLLTRPRAALP